MVISGRLIVHAPVRVCILLDLWQPFVADRIMRESAAVLEQVSSFLNACPHLDLQEAGGAADGSHHAAAPMRARGINALGWADDERAIAGVRAILTEPLERQWAPWGLCSGAGGRQLFSTSHIPAIIRCELAYITDTGACTINRPCAQQYVGKYQSCMVISGRLIVHAPVDNAATRVDA